MDVLRVSPGALGQFQKLFAYILFSVPFLSGSLDILRICIPFENKSQTPCISSFNFSLQYSLWHKL
jgi:hypothetical protein